VISKLRRSFLVGAWMLGALFFAGCGPGLGGTGTGAAAFAAFGASAAPVCGGVVAGALACPSAPAGPPPSGTLPVQFADVAGQVVLEVNGNFAQLDDSCLKLHFSGEFGTAAGGAQLTTELHDVQGLAVVGPVLLRRVTVPLPAPNPC